MVCDLGEVDLLCGNSYSKCGCLEGNTIWHTTTAGFNLDQQEVITLGIWESDQFI